MTTPHPDQATHETRPAPKPLPSPSARFARLATLATAVCLALALALLLFVAWRPLVAPDIASGVDVPQVPAVHRAAQAQPTADRAADRLANRHSFSTIRRPLRERPQAAAVADDTTTDTPPTQTPEPEPATVANPDTGATVVIMVDEKDRARPEIRQSLDSIKLFGLFRDGDERTGAVLGLVHADRPDDPRYVDEGATFRVPDPRSKAAADVDPLEWKLTAVDEARGRVLISHNAATYAISLFGDADTAPLEVAAAAAPADDAPTEADPDPVVADDGTIIVRRTARQIREELEAAGEDASIEELFRIMDLGGTRNNEDPQPTPDPDDDDNNPG